MKVIQSNVSDHPHFFILPGCIHEGDVNREAVDPDSHRKDQNRSSSTRPLNIVFRALSVCEKVNEGGQLPTREGSLDIFMLWAICYVFHSPR